MQISRALLAAPLVLSALLAGCSSASGSGFTVTAPAQPGGAYTFKADASADNYTWDLGDHLTMAYGKSVTHAYDFKDGSITVTLKATAGGQSKEYNQPLTVGTGVNQKATFLMEAQTDWTVTGETIKFSAARSFDPEHDPLRFTWSCLRTADATRLPSHTHPVYGVPFASPPAGSVTTGKTNRTLPAPDRTFDGDLCDALGSGTRPSTTLTTIAGHFTRTGIYSIYLLATDGPHPTTSGEFKLYVTTPGERPAPVVTLAMNGTFTAGSNGNLQQVCGSPQNPQPMTCDQASGTFTLALGGLTMAVDLAFHAQNDPAGLSKVGWVIKRGDSTVASGDGTANPDHQVISEPAKLGAGTYTATVTLAQGVQVAYALNVTVHLDMDPAKVY